MNTNEIERLLQIVSPSLSAGYELKNLNGKSLSSIYEEYKVIAAKLKKSILVLKWLFFASILTIVIASIYLYILTNSKISSGVFILVGCLATFLAVDHVSSHIWKYSRSMCKCEDIFNEFEQSVKVIDPQGTVSNLVYTEKTASDILVEQAARLFNAHKNFTEIFLVDNDPVRSLFDTCDWGSMFHSYNTEAKCIDELEKMLKGAEKFGLLFNKAELLAEAKART